MSDPTFVIKPPETPTQQMLASTTATVTVRDSAGRTMTLGKPGVLAQYRMIEMLGPERSQNAVYCNMVLPLLYLSAIDGESIPKPSTHRELEALIQRLDEHGIAAVVRGVNENFGERNPEADKAALKN